MDKKTIFVKTAKGEREGADLSSDLKRILSLIDNKSKSDELAKRAPPSLRESWNELLNELVAGGYIVDKNKPVVEPKFAVPKFNPLKMFAPKPAAANTFAPKPAAAPPADDLDYHSMYAAPAPNAAELAAKQKAEQAARARAEVEAAVAAAKVRADAEAAAKAEAKARQEAEIAARARAVAEAKAKQEAAARMHAQQEAASGKATLEDAARAKTEAEARVRAEIETAARAQQEAEAKAKAEAEAARRKAEDEAARIRAELEADKARAEAEARALAEARARQAAEEKARLEAEAMRLKAEQEAAARAKAKAEAEAAARRKAEQEVARLKSEQEALARAAKASEAFGAAPAFEIKLDGFLGGTEPEVQTVVPEVHAVQSGAEAEAVGKPEAEQHAATGAKAKTEKNSMKNAAAEMARLKAEAEAKADVARRKAEENARRQAEEQALAEEQAKAWAEAEQRAKAQAKIEAEQAVQQAALSQAKAQKPIVRVHRKPLPLGKIAFGLIALALLVAILLPYVYPLNEYVAPLEQRLSAQLKQPVHIGAISAASLPPKLQLQNVTMGKAQEVKVGSIVLNFDPLSLFSRVKVISNAELKDVSIEGRLLDKQVASLKLMGGDAEYPVRHLTLQRAKIVTDEVALPILSGIADLDAHGAFSRISLHSDNDKLGIDLQSNQGRWQLGVNLKESALPLLPDVVFSDLSAKGDLTDGEVNFTEMDAHIYKGILLGSAKLSWRKGWQLQGSLEAKTFELDKMFPKYGVDGEVFGEGTFSLTGAKLSQMDDAPRLDGSFTVKKGTVNIDMVETARLLSREHLVGGRTHFDDMIGLVHLENHTSHFRQLRIVSGVLSANGSFDVTSGNQLSGNLNAEIKMRAGNNLLTLFGTLDEPKLRAGR